MENRVWQRVYARAPQRRISRRELWQCLRRTEENFAYYERRTDDPLYGDAFARLAAQSAEQCKMLRQMLQRL